MNANPIPAKKTAVVTGAGGTAGIGRTVARTLAEGGWHVALIDNNADGLAEVEKELVDSGHENVLAIPTDITSKDSVAAAFAAIDEKLPPVVALVNLAGIACPVALHEIELEEFERVMAVNVTGSADPAGVLGEASVLASVTAVVRNAPKAGSEVSMVRASRIASGILESAGGCTRGVGRRGSGDGGSRFWPAQAGHATRPDYSVRERLSGLGEAMRIVPRPSKTLAGQPFSSGWQSPAGWSNGLALAYSSSLVSWVRSRRLLIRPSACYKLMLALPVPLTLADLDRGDPVTEVSGDKQNRPCVGDMPKRSTVRPSRRLSPASVWAWSSSRAKASSCASVVIADCRMVSGPHLLRPGRGR